jgi:hypothetical protein
MPCVTTTLVPLVILAVPEAWLVNDGVPVIVGLAIEALLIVSDPP